MATYIYETVPTSKSEEPIRFEYQQSMNDDPLTRHPETGAPVKRVITGGYGISVKGSASAMPIPSPSSSHCHSGSCGCSGN